MVKRFLQYFVLLLAFSCCSKNISLKRPEQNSHHKLLVNLGQLPVDIHVLSALSNKAALENDWFPLEQPLTPYAHELFVPDPVEGPFLLSNDRYWVVVNMDKNNHGQAWLQELQNHSSQEKEIKFLNLSLTEWPKKLGVSLDTRALAFDPGVVAKINQPNPDIYLNQKIKLTPQWLANQLSSFNRWEGAHFNPELGTLQLLGSMKNQSGIQITANDLIAAYRAVFVHEAAGEAIFVDMDFRDQGDQYLVTFGGGLQDTRPGRVLLAADLLLKALSSGIDPWTNYKPLTEEMCASPNKTAFQRAYCDIVKPEIGDFSALSKFESAVASRNYFIHSHLIVLATLEKDAWDYLKKMPERKKEALYNEIRTNGGFFRVPQTEGELKVWVENDDGKYDVESTIRMVKTAFSIEDYQKVIIEETIDRRFWSKDMSRQYASLMFISDEVRCFLRGLSKVQLSQLFNSMDYIQIEKLYELFKKMRKANKNGTSMEYEDLNESDKSKYDAGVDAIYAKISLIVFLSDHQELMGEFFKMSKEDRLIFSFLLSYLLVSPDFFQLVDQLQFHNPICNVSEQVDLAAPINSMESAFLKFVCKHLSEYDRVYLAELIRDQLGDEYKTAAEIRSDNRSGKRLEPGKIHTTRYWFYPEFQVAQLHPDLNTFLFHEPKLQARAEAINSRRGPYEAVGFSDPIPGVSENLDIVNRNYETLSEIFPTLKELNNLVRMLAFFRWIRDYQCDLFDMSAFEETGNYGTPTDRYYPVFQTVIPTQDGGLLKSIGGVDLHSKTQVAYAETRVNALRSQIPSEGKPSHFTFENNELWASDGLMIDLQQQKEVQKTITSRDRSFTVKNDGFQSYLNSRTKDELKYTVTSDSEITNEWISRLTDYSEPGRLIDVFKNYALNSSWTYEQSSGWNWALRDNKGSGETDSVYLADFSNWLEQIDFTGLSNEGIWLLTESFGRDMRMIDFGSSLLFSIKLGSAEYHLLKSHDQVRSLSTEEAERYLLKKWSYGPGTNGDNITQIRLIEEPSYDMINQSNIIRVNPGMSPSYYTREAWDGQLKSYNLTTVNEASNTARPIVISAEQKVFAKGSYPREETSSRSLLAVSASHLGMKKQNGSGEVYLMRNSKGRGLSQLNSPPKVNTRYVIVDESGFSHENKRRLKLAMNSTLNHQSFFFKSDSAPAWDVKPEEIVWVTALSESEITSQISLAIEQGWLDNTSQLRVMNIGNAVMDLGEELFQKADALQMLSAWPHAVDIFTFMPLLESILADNGNEELDTQINLFITKSMRDNVQSPTPMKLRVNRQLPELARVWKELSWKQGLEENRD